MSCLVPGPKGEFNGIIVATLDPEYFKTLLASVQYAPDMWVAIAHGDGIQFLMVPDREGQSGKNLAQPGSFFSRHRESGRDENIISGKVYATGEERVMAIRTIRPSGAHLDKPLVVAVGRDLHAVFAVWRRTATIYGSVYFGIVLITVFFLRYYQISVRQADERARQSKAALEKSEYRYRILAENATDVVWQLDLRTMKFTYVSPSVFRLRGYTPEEVMSQPMEASLTPDSQKNVKTWMGQMLEEFSSGRTDPHADLKEVEQPRKDGTTVWTEVSTTYVLNDEHQPIGVIGISRDITERRWIAERLRKSEARLRTVTENAPDTILQVDRQGIISFINRPVPGLTRERVVGSSIYEWVPREQHALLSRTLDAALTAGQRQEYESKGPGPNGEVRTYKVRIIPVMIGGQADSVIYVAEDITERRRVEDERYANEIKFRAIFKKSIDAIGVSSVGIHVFVNPAYAALFGYASGDELVGKPILDLIAPGERATIQDKVRRRAQRETVPAVYETRGLRKDGSEFVMDVHASTYELFGATYTLVIMRDITERKRAEQDREKLIAELRKALAEIRALHGILPICSSCKKIRDDKGSWRQMETYISEHTDVEFSHGLCNDCAKKLFPKYYKEEG